MRAFGRRRHRVRLVVGSGVVAVLLAACGTSTSGSGDPSTSAGANLPKTLVFSPLSLAPPALKGLSEGVKAYAGSQGWEVIIQDPNFEPAKQVQQLNEVLQSGRAGAAWVLAIAPASMGPVIETAKAKGIPMQINGRPDEYGFNGPQPGLSFNYIDYPSGGKALGEYLGKCVNAKLGGKASVLYATSPDGTGGKQETDAAAQSALKATAPGATIAQTIVVKDRAGAQTDIGSALQGNPDITAVMAGSDEGVLGAIGAFAAAGRPLPCLTDAGGNDEVLQGVKDGKIYAAIALQFQEDMTHSFDTLVKMQADPTAVGAVNTVPQKIITAP
jgi:ABC-type sugar transport system substrate-binding protein